MENQPVTIPANEIIYCDACHVAVNTADTFCNNCGYPLKGTEQEQGNFIAHLTVNEIELSDLKAKIKKGGDSLYYVAAAFGLGVLVSAFASQDDEGWLATLIIGLIICGIFVFLGSYARKKPFAALVSGISLYLIITILIGILDPVTLFRGFIFKIIIIILLINGLRAALAAEKIMKETHLR